MMATKGKTVSGMRIGRRDRPKGPASARCKTPDLEPGTHQTSITEVVVDSNIETFRQDLSDENLNQENGR